MGERCVNQFIMVSFCSVNSWIVKRSEDFLVNLRKGLNPVSALVFGIIEGLVREVDQVFMGNKGGVF
jgi:hypothetical protein